MQLAEMDYRDVVRTSEFLHYGKMLAQSIDMPLEDDRNFESCLLRYGEYFFPKLERAFRASPTQLAHRSREDRAHLKRQLLEDMRDNVSTISAVLTGEKRLGSERLPSDPSECMQQLDRMEDAAYAEVERLRRRLTKIAHAREMARRMQRGVHELAEFKESVFASEPLEFARPLKKHKGV